MSPLAELGLVALGLFLAGRLSERLGLSAIVGYIGLGLVFGPYGAIRLYELDDITSMLGDLGIILLLFFLGLEFSLKRFREGGRNIVVAGLVDLLNLPAGVWLARLSGLDWISSFFLGAIVYISSSGVITKLLSEQNLSAYPEAERTLGVLIFEDLVMVVVLAGLTLATTGGGFLGLLGVILVVTLYVDLVQHGRKPLERLLRHDGEALVLITLGLIIIVAVIADTFTFPEAVAAFLLGMVIGETKQRERIEHTLAPWRDVAAAVFFLDFGLEVDLLHALTQIPAALGLALLTVGGNTLTGFVAGRLTGLSVRASLGHGLMLIPRGEFSVVIVGLASSAAVIPEATRTTLVGVTSMYVVTLVILSSFIYRYYDPLTVGLAALLPRGSQQKEQAQEEELEEITLD